MQVTLKNIREHDITIAVNADGEGMILQATIPGAKQDANDKSVYIPGTAQVDSDLIDLGRRKSPVVDHYFTEGWLVEADKRKDEPKKVDPSEVLKAAEKQAAAIKADAEKAAAEVKAAAEKAADATKADAQKEADAIKAAAKPADTAAKATETADKK